MLIPDAQVVSDAVPVAIGGIGGSGTRVIAQLLIELGFDMGSDLNDSLDDLGFTALFKRLDLWPIDANLRALEEALAVYITSRGCLTPATITAEAHQVRAERLLTHIGKTSQWLEAGTLQDRVKKLAHIESGQTRWGWKEPNTLVLLPYLMAALPQLKYIHMLRDGRDMAYSQNKNQLRLWGNSVLGRPVDINCPQDALDYWCEAHRRLVSVMDKYGHRILLIRLESCIEDTSATITRVMNFLDVKHHGSLEELSQIVSKPQSLRRYRAKPSLTLNQDQIELFQRLGYRAE
jgi:hypothetical protein